MSIAFELGGSPLTNAVDLRDGLDGLTSNANYGELGGGGIVIHDPNGSLDIQGWTFFRVLETTATPPTIAAGYIYGRPISRLEGHTLSRKWDCDFVDLQTLLKFRIIHGADGKRPAETDLARVAWLLGSDYLAGIVVDAGLVNVTDNPINFGEADYRGRFPIDVLGDIAGISAKQFFVYYDETDGAALFYDLATAPVKDAGISVSNDPAEIDPGSGIVPAYTDEVEVTIFRSPEDVNSGVRYTYKGVSIYRQREATVDEFGVRRDGAYDTDRVGKAATAEAQAAAWLENHSVEKDTITFEIQLEPADVNLVTAGDRIQVRWEHLPGYDPAVWTRVTQRIVRLEDAPEHYVVRLQCSLAVKHDGGGGGGGSGFPWQPNPCSTPDLVNTSNGNIPGSTCSWSGDFTPTEGNVLLVGVSSRNGHSLTNTPHSVPGGAAWTVLPGGYAGGGGFTDSLVWYVTVSDGTETGVVVVGLDDGVWVVYEIAGADPASASTGTLVTSSGTAVAASVDCPAGQPAFVALAATASGDSTVSYTPDVGWTEAADRTPTSDFHPHFASAYKVTPSASATETPGMTLSASRSWHAQAVVLFCTGDSEPPLPGQQVPPRAPTGDVDGTNPNYVAPFPFSDGSLEFLHDGIDQTDHVDTYDGETGDFSLDYNPSSGSTLLVRIQGR